MKWNLRSLLELQLELMRNVGAPELMQSLESSLWHTARPMSIVQGTCPWIRSWCDHNYLFQTAWVTRSFTKQQSVNSSTGATDALWAEQGCLLNISETLGTQLCLLYSDNLRWFTAQMWPTEISIPIESLRVGSPVIHPTNRWLPTTIVGICLLSQSKGNPNHFAVLITHLTEINQSYG